MADQGQPASSSSPSGVYTANQLMEMWVSSLDASFFEVTAQHRDPDLQLTSMMLKTLFRKMTERRKTRCEQCSEMKKEAEKWRNKYCTLKDLTRRAGMSTEALMANRALQLDKGGAGKRSSDSSPEEVPKKAARRIESSPSLLQPCSSSSCSSESVKVLQQFCSSSVSSCDSIKARTSPKSSDEPMIVFGSPKKANENIPSHKEAGKNILSPKKTKPLLVHASSQKCDGVITLARSPKKNRKMKQATLKDTALFTKKNVTKARQFGGGVRKAEIKEEARSLPSTPNLDETCLPDYMRIPEDAEEVAELENQPYHDDDEPGDPEPEKQNVDHRRELSTMDFVAIYKQGPPAKKSPEHKYKHGAVRKKSERRKLDGFECAECKAYYDMVSNGNDGRKVRMNQCSRHRAKYEYQSYTPPGYWDPGFPE